MRFDFKNKRILLAQPLVHGINGSTLVTLELAIYLKKRGANVVVYTYTLDDPAKTLYEEAGIHVDFAQSNPKYKLDDFDYIWSNSQTLPESIVQDLGKKHAKMPFFFFLHMSSMDWIPDEHPYIFELEERLSSLTLYICEEVRKTNIAFFKHEPKYLFFRNPAPMSFYREKENDINTPLKKVLFVSNYLPDELREVKRQLQKEGCVVKEFGEKGDDYRLLDENELEQYDAVISIAKTVQYCLVHNTPVYVYGKFGGCGWLNEKNYERARETNFCGSYGFGGKRADTIVKELKSGFKRAKGFQNKKLKDFCKDFLIGEVVDEIFSSCTERKNIKFDKEYINMLSTAQRFAMIRFEDWSNVWRLSRDVRNRDEIIAENNRTIQGLEKQIKEQEVILESRSVKAWLKLNRMIRRKNDN